MIDGTVNVVGQEEPALFQPHIFLGRNKVHRIRLDFHFVFRLQYHHVGMFAQNFSHKAFVIGGKMLNNNKGESGISGHTGKKLLKRFQPTGRSAYADDQGRCRLLF